MAKKQRPHISKKPSINCMLGQLTPGKSLRYGKIAGSEWWVYISWASRHPATKNPFAISLRKSTGAGDEMMSIELATGISHGDSIRLSSAICGEIAS